MPPEHILYIMKKRHVSISAIFFGFFACCSLAEEKQFVVVPSEGETHRIMVLVEVDSECRNKHVFIFGNLSKEQLLGVEFDLYYKSSRLNERIQKRQLMLMPNQFKSVVLEFDECLTSEFDRSSVTPDQLFDLNFDENVFSIRELVTYWK